MTPYALTFINDQLSSIVNYQLDEYIGPLPDIWWTGVYQESEPENENGISETNFILTGNTKETWPELETEKEKIRRLFIDGKRAILPNGDGIAVFYSNSMHIPLDTVIKRIQINLKIIEVRGS